MNYVFGFLWASNHYLQNSPLHLYLSETCACKINQDSYPTALNHVFIRLLWSWMSHTARQSLQGGRASRHDIGWEFCSGLLSLLSPAVGIGYFMCCCLLDRAANLLQDFNMAKWSLFLVFSNTVWPHEEITAHGHRFTWFLFCMTSKCLRALYIKTSWA